MICDRHCCRGKIGRIGCADRAGGPTDLSRQLHGVSTEGAHPLRGALPPLVHLIAIVLMLLIWAVWLYATLRLEGAV